MDGNGISFFLARGCGIASNPAKSRGRNLENSLAQHGMIRRGGRGGGGGTKEAPARPLSPREVALQRARVHPSGGEREAR